MVLTLSFVLAFAIIFNVQLTFWFIILMVLIALSTAFYYMIITVKETVQCSEKVGIENQKFKIAYFEKINEMFIQQKYILHHIVEAFNERKKDLELKEVAVKKNKEVYDQWKFDVEKRSLATDNEKKVTAFLLMHMSGIVCISEPSGKIIHSNRPIDSIDDFVKMDKKEMSFFLLKDYNDMILKNTANDEIRTFAKRVFHKGKLIHLIFLFVDNLETERLKQIYLKQSKEIQMMYDITKIISGRQTIQHMLQEALESMTRCNQLYAAVIRLYDADQGLVLTASYGLKKTSKLVPIKSVTDTHVGYAFYNGETVTLNKEEDLFLIDDSAKKLLSENKKLAYVPLKTHKKKLGALSIISNEKISSDQMAVYVSAANLLAVAIEKINLIEELKFNYFKTVESFVTATEIKSDRYGGHSRRVAILCKLIAEKLNLNASEVDDIYISGLLHDIGKLTYSETAVADYGDDDDHSKRGRTMVEKVGLGQQILEGIEYHHHNYYYLDGNNRVKEQPYYAQIIRIANDYDMKIMHYEDLSLSDVFELEIAPYSGTLYAPYFVRILKHFITEQYHSIAQIYSNEATDE